MTSTTISRGTQVFSHDGSQLGEVGETRPDHFQVLHTDKTPGMGDDFWLDRSAIETANAQRIVVGFVIDELQEYRTADPGAANVVPATSRHDAYIAGATEDEANELADPTVESTPHVGNAESR